jgi:molecular chaperone DnaK (HSP70)
MSPVSPDARRLSIDFGTCYSCAALSADGRVTMINDPIEQSYVIPSSVLLTPNGEMLIGSEAEAERDRWPDRYQTEFKRVFGEDVPLALGERQPRADELVAEILGFFKREADTPEEPITSAVLTVPVSYNENKRTLMRDAAHRVGFEHVELLEEPIAAVAAVHADPSPTEGCTLVYDLGGGTFDIALIRIDVGNRHVLGAAGDDSLGGMSFDRAIERDLLARSQTSLLLATGGVDAGSEERRRVLAAQRRARAFCRRVKHHLSQRAHFQGELVIEGEVIQYELTRDRLAELVAVDLDRTIDTCLDLLAQLSVEPSELVRVVTVGGSCRLPFIAARLAERLGARVSPSAEPELAVCRGAIAAMTPWSPEQAGQDEPPPPPEPPEPPESAPRLRRRDWNPNNPPWFESTTPL